MRKYHSHRIRTRTITESRPLANKASYCLLVLCHVALCRVAWPWGIIMSYASVRIPFAKISCMAQELAVFVRFLQLARLLCNKCSYTLCNSPSAVNAAFFSSIFSSLIVRQLLGSACVPYSQPGPYYSTGSVCVVYRQPHSYHRYLRYCQTDF